MEKNGFDIFISYRRRDAEAHARMLYNDLTRAGYSVFYDHNSLGAGDFIENIRLSIERCQDFVLLLSEQSLGERIQEPDDVLHQEIAFAISMNKRIIGIILSGFPGFPAVLPSDIARLPQINCLFAKMEYYDAMLARLMSGQFLSSQPRYRQTGPDACAPNKSGALDAITRLTPEQKFPYMRLLLDLGHEFNNSAECMRFYRYMDLYDRAMGLRDIGPYDGVIPTDLATYLSFFETLYLILVTRTLDIALVDELYRFRFFAACNNPLMQSSELLPLGYQYPNILDLYDLWSEHIRHSFSERASGGSFFDEIPQFERDLHKQYRIYRFAHNMSVGQPLRLIDRKGNRKDVILRRLGPDKLHEALSFQQAVLDTIPNNEQTNLFEPLTSQELFHSLQHDVVVGVYEGSSLYALLNLIPSPAHAQNLLLDLDAFREIPARQIVVVDCILVHPHLRGFGIQTLFLDLCRFYARHIGPRYLCAVVSPKNPHSCANFIRSGYRMVASLPKYHSVREYFLQDLEEN